MTTVVSLHNIDVSSFLNVLDTCKGNVYLVTREGDHLNLKSKLCQQAEQLLPSHIRCAGRSCKKIRNSFFEKALGEFL